MTKLSDKFVQEHAVYASTTSALVAFVFWDANALHQIVAACLYLAVNGLAGYLCGWRIGEGILSIFLRPK